MTMTVRLRSRDDRRELALAESSQLFAGLLAFEVEGDADERAAVRPLVEESATSWPGLLDRTIDAPPGAVIGLVSESPREAAALACGLASWAGAAGRDVVIVDGSVENPVIEKALNEHGDEGLVDAVVFGVSPTVVARRTLTRGVRVVTTGSHPLLVESVFAPDGLGRVLREIRADNVLMVLPRAHLRHAGRFLDVLVAVARDADALVAMAREGREVGIVPSVGVLLCDREQAAEAATADLPGDAAPVVVPEEAATSRAAGVAGTEDVAAESAGDLVRGEAAEGFVGTAGARRNEFVRPERFASPFINEAATQVVKPHGKRKRHPIRFGFVGWLAIVAIIIIVVLTVFDMTLRPGRLAWREGVTTGLDEPQGDGERLRETVREASGAAGEIVPPAAEAFSGDAAPGEETPAAGREQEGDGLAERGGGRADEAGPGPDRASGSEGDDVPFEDATAAWMDDAAEAEELSVTLLGSGGPYVVLLSSHRLRSAADWDAGQAEARGIPTRVVEVELPDSGTWYRVALAGGHPTLASAREALDIVRELGYEGAWLVREREGG